MQVCWGAALFFLLATTASCRVQEPRHARVPRPAVRPAPPQLARDAAILAPARSAADASATPPDLRPLLDQLGQRWPVARVPLPGPVWVEVQDHSAAGYEAGALRTALVGALGQVGLTLAADRAGAAAVTSLQLHGRAEPVHGKRVLLLAAVLKVSSAASGELWWIGGAQQEQILGATAGAPRTRHPTMSEALELARYVGRELRQKLKHHPGVPGTMVIEVLPVRQRSGPPIDGGLVGCRVLQELLGLPGVRAVLPPSERAVTASASAALVASYALKGKLTCSGGSSSHERLSCQLEVRLEPLIATNAPVIDASSTLLPPIAPETR